MESAFEPWIGQAVVVQLTLGRIRLSLRGTLLKDGSKTLLVRPEAGSEVEIPKTNVLAIEEAGHCCTVCHALPFEQNPYKGSLDQCVHLTSRMGIQREMLDGRPHARTRRLG